MAENTTATNTEAVQPSEKTSFFKKVGKFFYDLQGKGAIGKIESSIICVFIGLLIGFILMLCLDPANSLKGLGALLTTGFSSTENFARVLSKSTPMILSGLSIAFSFKLGLFNIGITGQVIAGAFFGVLLATMGCPWYVCLIVAGLAGAVIGFVPGILKAYFNVNEVLSGIMLNWITYYLIGLFCSLYLPSAFKDRTAPDYFASIPSTGRLPSMGLDKILPEVSVGLVIAIVLVIIFQIILDKTKFGFELKLSGSNKYAAKYAGINQNKNIMLALTLSGAFAGLAGFMIYATPGSPSKFLWSAAGNSPLSDGFTGISVSLIAQNSPIGCIFSSMLLSYIDTAQNSLKSVSNFYNVHYTELIKALIIYIASFVSFFNMIIAYLYNHQKPKKGDRIENVHRFNVINFFKKKRQSKTPVADQQKGGN